jgi:hypothetical protein
MCSIMSAIIMNHVLFEVYASATGCNTFQNKSYQKCSRKCDPNCEPFTFLDHNRSIVGIYVYILNNCDLQMSWSGCSIP